MESNPAPSWVPGDRRRVERRTAERRQRLVAVAEDRRRNRDRRSAIRRSGEERRQRASRDVRVAERRLTPLPFSFEEAASIRRHVETQGVPGRCPVCQGGFAAGPPVSRLSETVRELRCRDCNRAVMVSVSPSND